MFTAQQLKDAHAKVKTGADYPAYADELRNLGVVSYDFLVADGSTTFYAEDEESVSLKGDLSPVAVADAPSKDKLRAALATHQKGNTDFPTFRQQAAEAGVAQWTTDLSNMEVVYVNKQEKVMLAEEIPA